MRCSMMFVFLVSAAFLDMPARAEVREGENLLVNGSFDAEQVAFPEFWTPSSSVNGVVYQRIGGPEGQKPAVVLDGGPEGVRQVSVRQLGLTLAEGETYRLSAYVKTKDYKSRSGGLIIHNAGWTKATGLTDLPADSDWTFREATFKLFPSRDHEYGVAMYATDIRGELWFADVKLEAISEGARKGSRTQLSLITAPRLVPVQPLLARIPQDHAQMVLKFYGVLPEKQETYEVQSSVGSNLLPPQTHPLGPGRILVKLDGLPVGEDTLKVVVRNRTTGQAVVETAWPIRLVDVPTIEPRRVQPLNNLVAKLLDEPAEPSASPQTFTFVKPRDGWVFVAISGDWGESSPAVCIDDQDLTLSAGPGGREAFCHLAMGEHGITLSGNRPVKARLLVHSIPEIFDYPPCANSAVQENGSYDWDFMKRHILQAVTTLNGGSLPGDALAEAKARGLKWLANFNVAPLDDPAKLQARMEKHAGMTQPQYDGFTSDELFFGRATIDHYTKTLWQIRNPQQRLIYTWVVGKPSIPALHVDFMSAALNASGGRGRLLYEAYCHPQADEQAARAYLDDMIAETMRRFNATLPHAAAGTGIIFGNFNQIPIISLEHDPAVDFKYFLDMQVNLVANSPDCAGLATTGYWGTYYGDEELARWSFLLMRHYAVEGRKDMLSARFGFNYNPGFVANGDFADGLAGWTAEPAADGAIRPDTIEGYGKNSQGRWGGGKAGDTVCVLTRQVDRHNALRQTARGLTVGKAYCLQFVTADRRDVVGKNYNPRRYGIEAELEGAEILPEKSFVHIDRRQGDNKNFGKINLHRIIFRARTPNLVLHFTDAGASPGEQLLLNFVQLKPYLE